MKCRKYDISSFVIADRFNLFTHSSTDYVVRPSTGDERQVFQVQVCMCCGSIDAVLHLLLDTNFFICRTFCLWIRSSIDTTSHTKLTPSGCTALNLWWGPWKGCLIRRCPSTKPGSTHCFAQTGRHMSPFSLWVRALILLSLSFSCGGPTLQETANPAFFLF